ncbi:MAG: fatty acyl-AMP ligase [Moorea sp. SIO4A3]|nr:fatty acyl-AMP ligase [Moorena sp. SIO4A3]
MYTKAPYLLQGKKPFSKELYLPFETLVDLLESRTLQQPDQLGFTFLADGEKQEVNLTYKQLDLQARAIAASLQARVSEGERVLLLYPSGLEYITAFFGCLYAGVIAIPVYPPKRNQKMSRLKAIVTDANPTLALTVTPLLDNIQERFAEHPELASLSCLATNNIDINQALNWQKPYLERRTIAFIQYTSGSTGTPKGVIVNHKNILHNSEYIQTAFQLTPKSVSVSWLPIFHDMGLIDGILQPLYTGFHGVFMSPDAFVRKPLRWLEAISHYRATHCGGPNFGYELCLDKIDIDQRTSLDLSSWLTAYSGAEPIRSETLKRFSKFFDPCGFKAQFLYPCYGMAETTLMVSGGFVDSKPIYLRVQANELENNHIIVVDNDSQNIKELVGCGRTWLDTKIIIADPETLNKTSSDQVGEILVSSASVAQGYWNKPEETKKTFQAYLADTGEGPFLRTGDLGFIRNGELFITGRLKDLIIIRGRNHYPQDIELTVEQSNLALRPNCGGAFSVEVNGEEELVIVQEVKRECLRKIDIDEVSRCIRRAVVEEHELQVYDVVLIKTTSIPKTSSGKIQRSACKQKYLNGEFEMIKGRMHSTLMEQKFATEYNTEASNTNSLAIL